MEIRMETPQHAASRISVAQLSVQARVHTAKGGSSLPATLMTLHWC
ncbi:unnamed protein product [Staurois parvus]|uniref:Uncharacterized protein n=1 Tax=Staurois parvus TaxID=386267 RepID=A0ABN9EGI7_9NEOB|nr:unnamed protein product [Staurois parvus]